MPAAFWCSPPQRPAPRIDRQAPGHPFCKPGDFFIADWLRNRNTVEFLGIWESIYNPAFNYGEFATIKSQAGLNSYKISVKEWVEKTGAIGLKAFRYTQVPCA